MHSTKRVVERYQVFLSHSGLDKLFVRQVAERLAIEGIVYFLDEANLVPGRPWQPAVEEALANSATCAVFIGDDELGPYHRMEVQAAITKQSTENRDFRVIPVLLPGRLRKNERDIPSFLNQFSWVEFTQAPQNDDEAFRRLKAGIEGKSPGLASNDQNRQPNLNPPETQQPEQFEANMDTQGKKLVSAAMDRLESSNVAIKSLAETLDLQLFDKPKESARLVIDKLMQQPSAAQMLNFMIREMNKLDKRQEKAAADCIEQVAYLLIPATLTSSRVKEITMVMHLGDTHVPFNAKTKAMVETAIARINGREIKFRPVLGAKDNARGIFCLEDPPEDGMDGDGELFIDNFVGALSTMVGADLLGGTREEKILAINAQLQTDFDIDGWQYYYVFEYPKQEVERKVRFALAKKLDKLFPLLAVVGLDRSDSHADENDLVTRMMRILCRAAGIEYKPHG